MNSNKITTGANLIVLGIIFLLMNLGYISFNILFSIFDLWPLILIVAGVNILFKKRRIVSFITWTLFFIILIIYGSFYEKKITNSDPVKNNIMIEKPRETVSGKFDLDIGAARVNINSEEENLLSASLDGRELDYKENFKNNKEAVSLSFKSKNIRGLNLNSINSNYSFNLNKDMVWNLDLDLGAVSGKLNLEEVPVKAIDLDFGAGDIELILGNKYSTNIKIDSGASSLKIIVPKDAGIRLKLDAALTKTNIEDLNLNKLRDHYVSTNYDDASTKLDFDIDMGAGKIDFQFK